MNLFRNSNILGGQNRREGEKPAGILFSGFLIAFLGASGIQAGVSENLSLISGPMNEQSVPACPKEKTSLASLEMAESLQKKKESSEAVSPECQVEKKIQGELKKKTAIPDKREGEIQAVEDLKALEKKQYEKKVEELEKLLKGYPLEKMAAEIAKQSPEIQGLIIGIARKESQWGKHSPRKNGDCFNYWGFKGAGGRGVGMGYACFATREEAIEKISNRLEKLVTKRGSSKPSALVTPWKCGNSCATHSKESVNKWVSDVNQYYTKVLAMK